MGRTYTVLGHLAPEDLAVVRMVRARVEAVKANPGAFSAKETVDVWLDFFRTTGEVLERFEVDVTQDWEICVFTGAVCQYDEE